ncbi:macrophage-expressed gene 1 protein-like [Gracilinanus agilis]|uniref:macrophage-expressed gene 1 protein-like n=1 Tax=Gracilinanus agilis TaxID=191870 RepID=UPI001CFCDB5A|nr:macrophage-expressed gene 1 protein-like [Gracilinanus agilis]
MALLLGSLLILLGLRPAMASRISGFQACKGAASSLPVLGVLPGGGWDNLRNLELGPVLRRNYSQCRVTDDREYLIPDQAHVVARRESVLETHSEIIRDWRSYTDAFAVTINAEASFLSVLNGKFSAACQRSKVHSVYDETVTARVQARQHIYSLAAQPPWVLEEAFRQQLLDISEHLENNRSQQANYRAELLVLAYGTHVLTEVEAGASLMQEDQVRRAFLEDSSVKKVGIAASASAIFFSRIQVGANITGQVQNQQQWEYMKNTVSSKIQNHGGEPFYPGITLQKWQQSIRNRLVAIGRSGLPLPFFITPEALPELPVPSVRRLALTVQNAIHQYYAVNTFPGCLQPKASNFNFQANVDDGSCEKAKNRFTFGGVFQRCQPVSGKGAETFCRSFRIQNPLTGIASCPSNYTEVLLASELRSSNVPKMECRKQCNSCYWLFQCCKHICGDYFHPSVVSVSAYWCAPTKSPELSKPGFLFGGLYTNTQKNPLTKAQTCPTYFYPLVLFVDLKVCVSSNYELGKTSAIPFGGFFSCRVGNPLAGLLKGQSPGMLKEIFYQASTTVYPMKCPPGYSQHQAYLSEGCQILYCLQAGSLFAQQLAPIHLPPFLRPPLLNESSLEDSDANKVSRRSSLGRASQEALDFGDFEYSGPSMWAVAGIWMTLVTSLVIVAGVIVWIIRYYNKRKYLGLPVRYSGSDQGMTMEEPQISLA